MVVRKNLRVISAAVTDLGANASWNYCRRQPPELGAANNPDAPSQSFIVEDTASTVSPRPPPPPLLAHKKKKPFNADSLHQRTLSPTRCHPSPMSSGRERSAGSRAGEVIPFKELCQIFNLVPPEGSKVTSVQYWLFVLDSFARAISPEFPIF